MPKKEKVPSEPAADSQVESPGTVETADDFKKSGTPKKTKRSKGAAKDMKPKIGKRGRPKGSKNKPKTEAVAGKRPRGRPPESGKKSIASIPNLRVLITDIVRKEVNAALIAAFKGV